MGHVCPDSLFYSIKPDNRKHHNTEPKAWDGGNGKQHFSVSFSSLLFPFHFSSEVNKVPVITLYWLHQVYLFIFLCSCVSPLLNLKVRHNQHPEALCIIPRTVPLLANCGECFANTLPPFRLTQNKCGRCLTQAGPAGANVMMPCCCLGPGNELWIR